MCRLAPSSGVSIVLIAAIALVLALLRACPALAHDVLRWEQRSENLLSNGGFETNGTEGQLAADWVGFRELKGDSAASVERVVDAHSGQYAVRLRAEGESTAGLNRAYAAGEGRGAMLPQTRGWVEFWYKAIHSQTGENLRVCVIGMPEDGSAEVGGRQTYAVPPEHIGDGQWHRGTIHFDYGASEETRAIQIAPRINEGGRPGDGELWIDDIAVYRAGPDCAVDEGGFSASVAGVGETVSLRGRVRNISSGDAMAISARAQLTGPAQIVGASETDVADVAPGQEDGLEWDVRVTGIGPITARVIVGGGKYAETSWPAVMLGVAQSGEGEAVFQTAAMRLRYIAVTDRWGTLAVDARPDEAAPWRPAAAIPFLGWGVVGPERSIVVFPAYRYSVLPATWGGEVVDAQGRVWGMRLSFSEGPGGSLRLHSSVWGPKGPIHTLMGPWVLVGQGQAKTEACLPGLEYLTAEEASGNELDGVYPLNLRWAPHPNKVTIPAMSVSYEWGTVGLTWDPLQKWDGRQDRPQPVFSTPNHLGDQPNTLFSLALPGGMQGRGENHLEAEVPYTGPDVWLQTSAELFCAPGSNTDAAMKWYLDNHGPAPEPELPRGLDESLRLCLDSTESRFDPESQGWYGTSWWSRGTGRSPVVARMLWLDSFRTDDQARRDLWRSRARMVADTAGGSLGLDSGLYLGDLWSAVQTGHGSARAAVGGQQEAGGWGYGGNANWELGEQGKAVSGTTAARALELLEVAAVTGDPQVLQAGLRALHFCNVHDPIPRGGQTWEVPLHTPDVIVAGYLLMGHIRAYELTGDPVWLAGGRHWAYSGLPFVYQWHAPERPIMPYSTIPVLGCSGFTNPWYGRPVQWCGIALIHPYQRFAEYDREQDWAAIARGLVIASTQQQVDSDLRVYPDTAQTQEADLYWAYPPREDLQRYVGMYPDNFRLFADRDFCWGYMLSPNSHIPLSECVAWELGLQTQARTWTVAAGAGRIHVTAPVPVRDLTLEDGVLSFGLDRPLPMPVRAIVACVGEPAQIAVDGQALPRGDTLSEGAEAWEYHGLQKMAILQTAGTRVRVSGIGFSALEEEDRSGLTRWDFEQPGDSQGFAPDHDIVGFSVSGGRLHIVTSGDDPYFSVSGLAVDAERYKTVRVRLAVSLRNAADRGRSSELQLFFAAPGQGPEAGRVVSAPVRCDGQMHEVALLVSAHEQWRGTIGLLRLDPTHGLGPVEVEIEEIWLQ